MFYSQSKSNNWLITGPVSKNKRYRNNGLVFVGDNIPIYVRIWPFSCSVKLKSYRRPALSETVSNLRIALLNELGLSDHLGELSLKLRHKLCVKCGCLFMFAELNISETPTDNNECFCFKHFPQFNYLNNICHTWTLCRVDMHDICLTGPS